MQRSVMTGCWQGGVPKRRSCNGTLRLTTRGPWMTGATALRVRRDPMRQVLLRGAPSGGVGEGVGHIGSPPADCLARQQLDLAIQGYEEGSVFADASRHLVGLA